MNILPTRGYPALVWPSQRRVRPGTRRKANLRVVDLPRIFPVSKDDHKCG